MDEITDEDTLLPAARRLAKESSHISTSLIQRRLHVGYPRAARIMDSLERDGLISRSEPGSPAEVIEAYEEEE
jgi:S-DNA-T family DNA segregation ATPase FtsK/SpoIIIE